MNLLNKIIKHEDWPAWSLLALGFIFRLIYIFNFTTPLKYLYSDMGGYDDRALQIAQGRHIPYSTYFPPLFHIFLSLIYRPLVWLGLEAQRIKVDVVIFAFFYIVAFWCIYQITKKLFPARNASHSDAGGSQKTALVVLAVLIFWYPFIFLNYVIMSENLFIPLFFLGLYFLILRPESVKNWTLIGFLWGLAFLARPIFAFAFPLFFFWALYHKINWRPLAALTIMVAVIAGSMMAFNFYYTKGAEKSISSNGGVCFAMLWCDAKSIQFNVKNGSYWFGPPANIDYPDSKKIYTGTPFGNQLYYYKMGLDCIKQHPERLVTNIFSIKKVFSSYLFPTIENVIYWQELRLLFRALTIILFASALLSIAGMAAKFIKIGSFAKKYLYLFGLIALSLFIIVYLQNVGEERYIIPYAPLLMLMSVPLIRKILSLPKARKTAKPPLK